VPRVEELSALGSANMAGLATGFWSGLSELEQKRSVIAEFVPQMDEEKRIMYKKGWHDAVRRALSNK
jgi:glycerol kinase